MKGINGFRWTGVLAAFAVCAAFLLQGCGGGADQLVEEGYTYLRIGRYEDAADAFRKAEEIDAENAAAKEGLARCALAADDFEEAVGLFMAALRVDENRIDAYRGLFDAYLAQDKLSDAAEVAQQLAEVDPEQGQLLYAEALLEQGKTGEALSVAESLLEEYPQSPRVHVAVGRIFLETDRVDAAREVLEKATEELNADSDAAWVSLAEVYIAQEETEALLERLGAIESETPQAERLAVHRLQLAQGDVRSAEEGARAILRAERNAGWAMYIVALALVQQQQIADARNFISRAERHVDVHTLELPEDIVDAQQAAAEAEGEPAGDQQAQAAADQEGETDAGWRDLWLKADLSGMLERREEIAAQGGDALKALTLAAVFTAREEEAEELAQQLPEDSPIPRYVRMILSRDLNELREINEDWQESGEGEIMRQNAVGYALSLGQDRAQAVDVLSRCFVENPDNAVSLLNIAQVYRQARMNEFAVAALQRLVARYPESLDAHALLYLSLRDQGETGKAQATALATYALFPDSLRAAMHMAEAYLDEYTLNSARNVLERTREKHPQAAAPAEGLARVYLLQQKPDAALEVLNEAEGLKDASAESIHSLRILAQAMQEDWAAVRELASQDGPGDLSTSARFAAASAYLRAGDEGKAQQVVNEASNLRAPGLRSVLRAAIGQQAQVESEEDRELGALVAERDAAAEFALAAAYSEERLRPAAVEVLEQLRSTLDEDRRLSQFLLINYANLPDQEEALQKARALAESHPEDADIWLGLYHVLNARDMEEGRREAIAKAAELAPENPAIWLTYGQYLERSGDMEEARDAYERVLELNPSNPIANNNLAYMMLQRGENLDDALAKAEKAVEVVGRRDPNLLHTLGVAQMRADQLEESAMSIRLALALRPGDPTFLYDYGRVLFEMGEEEAARQHILRALQFSDLMQLEFPQREEALSLLRSTEV